METVYKGIKTISARTRKDWRKWLAKNHQVEKSVWLIIYRKQSNMETVIYDKPVEEAICFGWINSIANRLMKPAGQTMIDLTKARGTWEALIDIQNSIISTDLQNLFNKNKITYKNSRDFSPSSKRIIPE